jgi:diguanylate cyclase (GGDEF)-like protein/PAS domain S-box-containing protein
MHQTPFQKIDRNQVVKLFLKFYVSFSIIITVFGVLIFIWQKAAMLQTVSKDELNAISMLEKSIRNDTSALTTDLKILSKYSTLTNYIDNHTKQYRDDLEKDFIEISQAKHIYDQIRLLDLNGYEDIRVDLKTNGASIIPDKDLQPKSDRYYFQNSINLNKGQIYISPMDLNIEHDAIELPYKPMVRAATPVFDNLGNKHGILVLNYLASNLLSHLADHTTSTYGKISLLNSQGFWLKAPTGEDEWGFMFPDKQNHSFAALFPHEWNTIAQNKSGQFITYKGIFSFITVAPFAFSSTNSSETAPPTWIVVSQIGQSELNVLVKPIKTVSLATGGAILLLLAPMSWLLARYRVIRDTAVAQLREREKLYRTLAENFPNGAVFLFNTRLQCLLAEGRGLSSLGINPQEIKKQGIQSLFHDNNLELVKDHFQKAIDGNDSSLELSIGNEIYQLHFVPVVSSTGEIFAEMLMTQNITEQKQMEEKLRDLASIDALTGLLNKRQFKESLDIAISFSKRYKTPLSLCMCDIDMFKSVNDVHGHQAGDNVISTIGSIIRKSLRETDQAGRYGGDEFIIALPNTSIKESKAVIDRIYNALNKTIFKDDKGEEFSVTSSFGISEFKAGQNADDLIIAADNSLYTVKHSGRNKICTDSWNEKDGQRDEGC